MKNTIFLLLGLFLSAGSFAQSTSTVLIPYRVKNLWGFADTSGNLKVSAAYKTVTPYYYYNGEEKKTYARYAVRKTTAMYVLDENLLVKVPESYGYDSVDVSSLYGLKDRYSVYKAGKTGLFANGKQLISCQYDIIDPTVNGSYIVEKDGLKGLVNSSGQPVIPVKYQNIYEDEYAEDENGKITWIARGMIAIERFSDKRLTGTDNREDILSVEEAVTAMPVPAEDPYAAQKQELRRQYDRVRPVLGREKYMYIERDGKTGLYSLEKKKVMIEPRYESLYECASAYTSEPEYFRFSENRLFGIRDMNGRILIPAEYSFIYETRYGYELRKEDKRGAYIFQRELLIPAIYESIEADEYIHFAYPDQAFLLFRVKTPEGCGYLGENGVRFFRE